jgi:hypothetical protein
MLLKIEFDVRKRNFQYSLNLISVVVKYHQSKQCRGLKKCTHTVKTISLKEAEKMGLTQCQIEK